MANKATLVQIQKFHNYKLVSKRNQRYLLPPGSLLIASNCYTGKQIDMENTRLLVGHNVLEKYYLTTIIYYLNNSTYVPQCVVVV